MAIGVAVLVLATGCGLSESAKPADAPVASNTAGKPPGVKGTASVAGSVRFSGKTPKPEHLDMDAVPACARQHEGSPAINEALMVGRQGSVKNAYVWIEAGLPEAVWPVPVGNAKIDQKGCLYLPRVVAIQAGQGVEFTNHDPTNHNIHPVPEFNTEVNRIQAPNGAPLVERFDQPEVGILIRCNVHPWMKAWVHVAAHPFWALTEADGNFIIRDLPAGEYTLSVWHETLGRKHLTIRVGEGEQAAATFTF
jgi:plastocyanin